MYPISINPGFGRRYVNIYSRVARSEQARLQRTLKLEYKGRRRRPCQSYFSACSVFFAVEDLVLIRVHSWFNSLRNLRNLRQKNNLFMQNKPNFDPFLPLRNQLNSLYKKAIQKNLQFCRNPKTNPIQSQSKPNLGNLGNMDTCSRRSGKELRQDTVFFDFSSAFSSILWNQTRGVKMTKFHYSGMRNCQ